MARKQPFLPLKGIRILAFETAFSLPAGTRHFADLGAEVVRIASAAGAGENLIHVVDGVSMNKPCISINLKNDKGKVLARELALQADIVCNNFRPQVLEKFGLGHETLRQERPELIVLQLSGYGTPGPWQDYPAYGPSVEAAGGMNRLMGGEHGRPVSIGSRVFADQLAGRYAAFALLSALHHRRQTGKGQYIDLSMYECIAHLIGENFIETSITGVNRDQSGNRDPRYVPQGIYPCEGVDNWIAISVTTDDAWHALADRIGDPGLKATELLTRAGRDPSHDRIDEILGVWTAGQNKDELAEALQSISVAASPVQKVSDIHFDAHLKARGLFHTIAHDHPILGYITHPHAGPGWRSLEHEGTRLDDLRWSGRDNAAVLSDWLQLDQTEVDDLLAEGALADRGGLHIDARTGAETFRIDPDFAQRLNLKASEA